MSKRENHEAGFFRMVTMAVIAAAVCAAAVMMMPAHATSEGTAAGTFAGPTDYFPAQYVNQAKGIEPMPQMYE